MRRERFRQLIAGVPVFSKLPDDAHKALAMAANELLVADGEVIVAEGAPGQSMFVVCRGRVAITLGADRRGVAVTDAGGYFGEMSLMTGEPRTATVIARGDCTVLHHRSAPRDQVNLEPRTTRQRRHPDAGARRQTMWREVRRIDAIQRLVVILKVRQENAHGKHMLKPDCKPELDRFQAEVDRRWLRLKEMHKSPYL